MRLVRAGFGLMLLMATVVGRVSTARQTNSPAAESTPGITYEQPTRHSASQHGENTIGDATCMPLPDILLPREQVAHYSDCELKATHLFVIAGGNLGDPVLRYVIKGDLTYSAETLPIHDVAPWLTADLDLDGNMELIAQGASAPFTGDGWIEIYSAPDWRLRARLVFPSMNVAMHPMVVEVDDDAYREIYLAASNLGGASEVALADYNSALDTIVVIARAPAPRKTFGQSAVGDFDGDGRIEFITGNYWGYSLFEFDGQALNYGGRVGPDSVDGVYWSAVACRPKPDGVLYALIGSVRPDFVSRAWLLKPTGDNSFEIVRTFEHSVRGAGNHDVLAFDMDCDGLDELLIKQDSTRVWEWDENLGDFVLRCTWEVAINFQVTDLDQDGAHEWSGIESSLINPFLRPHEDQECSAAPCGCPCQADPVCDGVSDMADLVRIIDRAFRNGSAISDAACTPVGCIDGLTDVDCSGCTDVVDVVEMIAVVFRHADPRQSFCAPCP